MAKFTTTFLATLAALSLLTSCASPPTDPAEIAPLQVRVTEVGVVLTDPNGLTLYTYKDDPEGASICFGRCARKWPPMQARPGAPVGRRVQVIARKDGVRQYVYNGRPLYRWVKDKSPGDTTGHKVGEVWYVARP